MQIEPINTNENKKVAKTTGLLAILIAEFWPVVVASSIIHLVSSLTRHLVYESVLSGLCLGLVVLAWPGIKRSGKWF